MKTEAAFPAEAQWIWLDGKIFPERQKAPVSYFIKRDDFVFTSAFFTQAFEWDGEGHPYALVTGDCRFRIFLDGVFWYDGPPECGGDYLYTQPLDWRFYERLNLPPSTGKGRHQILVEVISWNNMQSDYSCGHSGFRMAIVQKERLLLVTDPNWRCCVNPGYLSPGRTRYAESDELPWTSAAVVTCSQLDRQKLLFFDAPSLSEQVIKPSGVTAEVESERLLNAEEFIAGKAPLRVKAGKPYSFYVNYPGEYAGLIDMQAVSHGNVTMELEPREKLDEAIYTKVHVEKIETCARAFHFQSFNVKPVHHLKLSLVFRDENCSDCDVDIFDLSIRARHYPVGALCSFECSASHYADIRDCCSRTLKLCMQRMHYDSPVHQEPLGCLGDYYLEMLQSYYLYGEYRLARIDLVRLSLMLNLSRGKLFHTGFALFYIMMLRDYVLFSGDLSLLHEDGILSACDCIFEAFAGMYGESGVISEAPNYMFVDWIPYGSNTLHHPSAAAGMAVMNAFYAMALKADEEIAALLGNTEQGKQRRQAYERLMVTFNALFYDAERNCYRNGIPGLTHVKPNTWLPEDEDTEIMTPHSSIAALAAGFVPKEHAKSMMSALMGYVRKLEVQPYFCHFVFEALFKTKLFNDEFDTLMSLWHTIYLEHPESLKECWQQGDYSHAWCGSPAIWLSRGILGVSPLSPGFKRCLIAPFHGHLDHAQGEVMTPHGRIRVQWLRQQNKAYLQVSHPREIECVIDTSNLCNDACVISERRE